MTTLAYVLVAALLLGVGAAIGFLAATIRALSRPAPTPPSLVVGDDQVKAIAEATVAQCVATMQHLLEKPRLYSPGLPDPGQKAREAEYAEYMQRFRAEFPELAVMIAAEPS